MGNNELDFFNNISFDNMIKSNEKKVIELLHDIESDPTKSRTNLIEILLCKKRTIEDVIEVIKSHPLYNKYGKNYEIITMGGTGKTTIVKY